MEKAGDDDRQLVFLPIGKSEKLIERLGGRVAPAAFGCGSKDKVGVFAERNVGIFPVNFRGRCGENEFLFFAGGFEDQLCAVYVGLDGPDRALDDEFYADGGG